MRRLAVADSAGTAGRAGALDVDEFRSMCREMNWADEDIDGSLKLLDSDGDGEISFNEFLTWYTDDGM